ncbi:MAG: GGDEF domain-containing protein, partial [Leptospiraceae bacterium]|nr:GGDEF domain-containing protein [Leptospiraceae bacterium]
QIFLEINSEYLIWRAFFFFLFIVFLCILVMVQLYFSKESIEEFLLFCLILLCASGMALRGLVILKNNLNLDILKGMDDAIPFLIFTLSVNSVTITIIIITINKLNKELRKLADIDPLTGLFNRRALFDSAVPSLEKRYQPEDYFGIGLLDLDNFKKINDKYGHAAGDFVLVQFSDIILKQIRKFDIVARFGGEEFVVLIIDKDKNSIKEVFENIRSSLESTDIQFQNYTFHATVSIGMLIKNGNDFIFEECLHFADKALYKAKAKGRNCIVVKEA